MTDWANEKKSTSNAILKANPNEMLLFCLSKQTMNWGVQKACYQRETLFSNKTLKIHFNLIICIGYILAL